MQMCYEHARTHNVYILKLSKLKEMKLYIYIFLNFKNEKIKMYNFDVEKSREI